MLDVQKIKKDFPIFKRKFDDGLPLVYLDNAATSHKPVQVINSLINFYSKHNANVHRGIHTLSEEASEMYEGARETVAKFIGARKSEEVVFTYGTTHSSNLVAFGWGAKFLKKGDVVIIFSTEHHSNLVPWQKIAQTKGIVLEFIETNSEEATYMKELRALLDKHGEKVKLVVTSHCSNVLGTIFPIKEIANLAHKVGAKILVDGAQSTPHFAVNMQSLDCDFFYFSGHKMLAPTGIGVLFGKEELLAKMDPYFYGGGMIDDVELHNSTFGPVPQKFEAGTPNIAGAIGLAAAVDYLNDLGMDAVFEHEQQLTKYLLQELALLPEVTVLGDLNFKNRCGLASFTIKGIHSHDVASVLASDQIAVRSGHHCAMPLHMSLKIPASTRASLYLYNSTEDIDELIKGIKKAIEILG